MRFGHPDFSRTFLFFLGIVLHAAYLCVEGHQSFQSVHDVIHSFRMEAFYLIAGFFSAMSLERSPDAAYLRKRILRLGRALFVRRPGPGHHFELREPLDVERFWGGIQPPLLGCAAIGASTSS